MKNKLYNLIFEADVGEIPEISDEDVKTGEKTKLERDSLDDQIDSLLIKYEKECAWETDEDTKVSKEDLNESVSNIYGFIFEVEGDEERGEVLDPAAVEAGATAGSEIQTEDDPAEESEMKIDIDLFSKKVGRLVKNYDRLLKGPTAIVNRAISFLRKNYNEDHVERFKAILEKQLDIIADPDIIEYQDDDIPQGLGAYDAGTGGGA
jgi:hypothetical protein